MNAIAYLRVSTDGQVGEDKFGLDSQREQIERYAETNGITIVEWFMDEGISGVTEHRQHLIELFTEILPTPLTRRSLSPRTIELPEI